jgi:hypothetical protein
MEEKAQRANETQKVRALRFREQLARLKSDKTGAPEPESNRSKPESPHDFTQRKMREIADSQESSNSS